MGKTEVTKVRYKCDICEKDYAKSIDLKFHVKCVHDGDTSRECACEICGNSYRRPDELTKFTATPKFSSANIVIKN